MGRGAQQPYMYDAAKSVDSFDPRAFSRKSWAPSVPPKPKKDGPLLEPSIEYNKHPDSYVVEKYGKLDAKPMGSKTKKSIKWSRWAQLGLRIVEIVGAVGVLICAICIKGTEDSEGWLMRIPPGVDMAACLYGIYHLCRAAKSRTPLSSAAYHFFASFTDAAAIPFYMFTVILTRNNVAKSPDAKGRWRSFFSSVNTTNMLLQTLWLAAITMAGLHFVSLIIDLYLVIMFRKISNLPPDMNPLEDNLTARPRKNKHKYKDSDATLAMSVSNDVKRASDMSGSSATLALPSPDRSCLTLAGSNRDFKTREPLLPEVEARNISFFHTRAESATTFSPHNPRTARMSQVALDEKHLYDTEVRSLHSNRDSRTETGSLREPTLAEIRGSLLSDASTNIAPPALAAPRPASVRDARNSFISSTPNLQKNHGAYSAVSLVEDDPKRDSWFTKNTQRPLHAARSFHGRSKSQYDLESDEDSEDDEVNVANGGARFSKRPESYQAVSQDTHLNAGVPPAMKPLGMNPPSPLHAAGKDQRKVSETNSIDSGSHYSNATNPMAGPPQAVHGRSKSVGTILRANLTPKGKFYGDLSSATNGIRRNQPSRSRTPSPPAPISKFPPPFGSEQSPGNRPKTWFGSSIAMPLATRDMSNPNLYSSDRNPYLRGSPTTYTAGRTGDQRVISTGREFKVASEMTGRRREVSGKVAEEGRGGKGWGGFGGSGWGMRGRKASATNF